MYVADAEDNKIFFFSRVKLSFEVEEIWITRKKNKKSWKGIKKSRWHPPPSLLIFQV